MRKAQAANIEGVLRIIQSIKSPKAEPLKVWLAKVGAERLDEIAGNARKVIVLGVTRSHSFFYTKK